MAVKGLPVQFTMLPKDTLTHGVEKPEMSVGRQPAL